MSKRWKMYLPAAIFFLAGLALLVYAFALTPDNKVTPEETSKVEKMFLGIEQKRALLGSPSAEERIVVFIDLQCVFCAKFSKEGLPVLLQEVRSGRLKLDLRPLSLLGPESLKGAEAAQAATLQNKGWQFAELFLLNQEPVNSGYIDDNFIRSLYRALDINEELAEKSSQVASKNVALDDDLAFKAGVRGTPSFLFIAKNGDAKPLSFASFKREDILKALREARN